MKRNARQTGGFTILEVVFVVGIIGMMMAIAVPAVSFVRASARRRQAETDVEILATGISQLAWDTGEWPAGLARNVTQGKETWNLGTAAAGLLSTDGRFENWDGPYVPRVDLDPWGSPYFFDPDYSVGGTMRVAVGSFGPNKQGRNWYDSDNIYVLLD